MFSIWLVHEMPCLCMFALSMCILGWPDLAFLPIGLLLEAHYDYLITWSSPKKCDIFGYFLIKQFFLHFHLKSSFKIWFVVAIIRVLKMVWCIYFELSNWALLEDILSFFGLDTVWATFWKFGQFFYLLVTLNTILWCCHTTVSS